MSNEVFIKVEYVHQFIRRVSGANCIIWEVFIPARDKTMCVYASNVHHFNSHTAQGYYVNPKDLFEKKP